MFSSHYHVIIIIIIIIIIALKGKAWLLRRVSSKIYRKAIV
jgi:hypothetical protein